VPLLDGIRRRAGQFANHRLIQYRKSKQAAPGRDYRAQQILLQNDTGHQEAARASAAGEYAFSGVPAGSYTMEVRAPGFGEFRRAAVLPAERTNITLAIGTVPEAVEVLGKAPPPPETGTPRRIRVGGNVQATKLVSMTKPVYPAGAEAAGIEGTVLGRRELPPRSDGSWPEHDASPDGGQRPAAILQNRWLGDQDLDSTAL
jgi:hypothetical protein